VSDKTHTANISLLLIEDDSAQRQLIKEILENAHYQVIDVADGEQGLTQLKQRAFDIVISDWKLPGISGEEVLEQLKHIAPETGFILITAHSDASHAINLIRAGADDYLPKPFDKSSLLFTLSKLVYTRQIENENSQLKTAVKHRSKLLDLIGSSSAMNRLFMRIEKAAPTTATILITGESGTGKELAASAIHQLSDRRDKPFVAINCAAIPESLAEAELFGAEKGAYTGAVKTRIGKLESASSGTVFLDEVGELPLLMQSKLLRFLQEGQITRVGSHQELEVNVRVVAATNRDLLEEVRQGNFREDLFYRLNVIPVVIPPLRNRQEDILPLIKHFLTVFSQSHGGATKSLSAAATKQLVSYAWPGNVRQLKNAIERLVLLSSADTITSEDVADLELEKNEDKSSFQLSAAGLNWEQHEKDCLTQALSHCNNNRSQAAKLMGLSYKAFLYRLEKYGLS